MDQRLLYKVSDVAQALSLSRSKAYELVRCGHIKSVRVDGILRVRGTDLLEYVESLRSAA